MRHFRCQRVGK